MKKSRFALLAALLATGMVLTACSTGQSGTTSISATVSGVEAQPSGESKASADAAATAPMEINMMQELFSAQPPDMTNNWYKTLEEKTNTKLHVNFIPTAQYTDKTNVLIASNTLPMVVAMNNGLTKGNSVITGIQNGVFWKVGDYLDTYPELKAYIGESVWQNSRIQGENIGIPRLRVLARNGMFYRKDWADKLGIQPPETLDDLYNMAKAFTENDPDGNGKKDTWGMEFGYAGVGNIGWNGIQTICTALGGPNGWEYKDGTMVPDFTTPAYLEALKFYKKLYDASYMNKDFAVLTGNKRYDVFNQGNAGMIFGVLDDLLTARETLIQVMPTAELTVAPVIKGEGDLRCNATSGYNGMVMFNKAGKDSIKTEEDFKRVLSFYNTMCTPEFQDYIQYGIEGDHYTKEGENKMLTITSDGKQKVMVDAGDFGQLLPTPAYVDKFDDPANRKEVNTAFREREKYIVLDPSSALISATKVEYGNELDKIIMDAGVKFIMGEIDEAGFTKEIETWKTRGGNDVIKEYTEQYDIYNK